MESNYLDWVKKAEEDWRVIKAIVKADYDPVSGILFHGQQVAEKYLKSFLSYKNVTINKIHDLIELQKLAKEFDVNFDLLKDSLLFLDGFSVAPRYPDEYEEYTLEDAKQAIQSTEVVRHFCRKILHLKN